MKYNYKNIQDPVFLFAFIFFAIALLPACDDDNGDDDNGEEKIWKPYEVKANTAYEYDFEQRQNNEVISSGSARIDIEDPEVIITGTIDNEDFSVTSNTYDDVNDNFISAISMTPLGPFLYQPILLGAFTNQNIKIGNTWSYTYEGNTISFSVTGEDEYAGYTGYVIETTYQDEEETIVWNSVVNPDIPLPLMTHIEYDNGLEYYIEITSFED